MNRSIYRTFSVFAFLLVCGCMDKSTSPTSENAGATPTTTVPPTTRTPPPTNRATPPPEPAAPSANITAVFVDNVLELKGQKITNDSKLADLEKLLGPPSKVETGGVNALAVWDDLGIRALFGEESKALVDVTFVFGSGEFYSHWPKKKFAGKITIDGAPVTKDTDIADLMKTRKDRPIKTNPNGESHYIDRKGRGAYLGIKMTDDKGKGVNYVYYTL